MSAMLPVIGYEIQMPSSRIITVTAVPLPLPGDGGMADRQRSTGNSQFLINGFSDKINAIII